MRAPNILGRRMQSTHRSKPCHRGSKKTKGHCVTHCPSEGHARKVRSNTVARKLATRLVATRKALESATIGDGEPTPARQGIHPCRTCSKTTCPYNPGSPALVRPCAVLPRAGPERRVPCRATFTKNEVRSLAESWEGADPSAVLKRIPETPMKSGQR